VSHGVGGTEGIGKRSIRDVEFLANKLKRAKIANHYSQEHSIPIPGWDYPGLALFRFGFICSRMFFTFHFHGKHRKRPIFLRFLFRDTVTSTIKDTGQELLTPFQAMIRSGWKGRIVFPQK
jgi:hypothetical protein